MGAQGQPLSSPVELPYPLINSPHPQNRRDSLRKKRMTPSRGGRLLAPTSTCSLARVPSPLAVRQEAGGGREQAPGGSRGSCRTCPRELLLPWCGLNTARAKVICKHQRGPSVKVGKVQGYNDTQTRKQRANPETTASEELADSILPASFTSPGSLECPPAIPRVVSIAGPQRCFPAFWSKLKYFRSWTNRRRIALEHVCQCGHAEP